MGANLITNRAFFMKKLIFIVLSALFVNAGMAQKLPTPDKTKAATYLNDIRKRAPAMAPATDATITIDMIVDERSKELFAEGHRFFDLIRLNRSIEFNDEFINPVVLIPHRAKIIDRTFNKIILPISKTEMNANPAIADQQNDGY